MLAPAQHDADRVAVRMGAVTLTYGQLETESARVAAGLRALGIQRGDRVMMFADNCVEHLVAFTAVARLGAVFAPVHPSFQADELEYVLANSTPRAVIAEPVLLARLARTGSPHLPELQVALGAVVGEVVAFDRLGRDATAATAPEEVQADAPVLICYTSGSTDRPHPVTRSHDHEVWNARTYAQVHDYRPSDVGLVTMPLSWVWGLSTSCVALLSVGATIVLHREFDAGAVLDEIERSGVTLFAGTMSMFTALAAELSTRSRDLSSLRRLYRGGELLNSEVVRQIEAHVGLRMLEAYATTEVSPVLAVDPLRDLDPPLGTAGRLVEGARIRLVDDQGADVPRGEVGEALLGGRGVMLGYWNEPDLTASRMTADGWFRSGDLVVEDEQGYYFVVGRSADIVIRNGAKIAPAEVESALVALPCVRDSVVVGVPDEEFGESIVAFVQIEPGSIVSVDDIYAQLADRIARFKLPGDIHVVSELPLHRNEKRDRGSLRRRALDVLLGDSALVMHGDAGQAEPSRLRLVD